MTFDAVIANHMLYHVPDIKKAISEMRRILKPTGKLFTATNGKNHLRELYELEAKFESRMESREGSGAWHSFELDSGETTLLQFFPRVALFRYPDELLVSEAQPLIDYIVSTKAGEAIGGTRRDDLRNFIQLKSMNTAQFKLPKMSGY